jgi:hypothetical protein
MDVSKSEVWLQIYFEEMDQSRTGPMNPKPVHLADRHKNLPNKSTQIAILEIGMNLEIESHGTIPWLSSL